MLNPDSYHWACESGVHRLNTGYRHRTFRRVAVSVWHMRPLIIARPGTHRMAPMLLPPSLPLAARVTFIEHARQNPGFGRLVGFEAQLEVPGFCPSSANLTHEAQLTDWLVLAHAALWVWPAAPASTALQHVSGVRSMLRCMREAHSIESEA